MIGAGLMVLAICCLFGGILACLIHRYIQALWIATAGLMSSLAWFAGYCYHRRRRRWR